MFVLAILAVFLSLSSAEKILGRRTSTNFPVEWKLLETPCPYMEIDFIIALKQQNLEKLEETFWDVSDPDSKNYRNFMSISDIVDMIKPEKEDVKKVIEWLKANGVDKHNIQNKGDSVHVKSSLEVASRLFFTEFRLFQHKETGKLRPRQFGEFSVPTHLEEIVDMVLGLSEFPPKGYTPKRIPKNMTKSPKVLVSIAPQGLQVIYKVGNAKVSKSGASVGVIEF